MKICELAQQLNLECICCPDPDKEINGAYIGDLLSWVMGRAASGNVWITIMSNINIVAVAALADVSAVILAEGVTVDDKIKETAQLKSINLFTANQPAYEIAVAVSKLIEK